jgi:alkylation response protein AidB-like acyl-CoA dehydrogenase
MSSIKMDFYLTETQKQVKQLARDFAEKEIAPFVRKYDEKGEFPFEIMKKLGEIGFLGITFPEEYGGSGLKYLDYVVIIEEISRVDPSIGLSVAAHNGLCTNHIYCFGDENQKRKYLPELCTGKKIGAWALTEPQAGSDAANLLTTAVKENSYYILNGNKVFTTHGSVGDVIVVMAVTDKTKGKNGISSFIVEKGYDGLIVGKKEDKLGMRASDTCSLIFDNCKVPVENLIGEEGQGYKQAMEILAGGRIAIAALSVGLAQGAFELSLKYSKERKAFGKYIAEFQAIQWKLADMATQIESARLLTYKAAYLKDQGKDYSLYASMAKYFASEVAVKCAIEAVQIYGGYGYIKEYPVEKFYRDAKLLTIGEGTSEIQKIIIANKILKEMAPID